MTGNHLIVDQDKEAYCISAELHIPLRCSKCLVHFDESIKTHCKDQCLTGNVKAENFCSESCYICTHAVPIEAHWKQCSMRLSFHKWTCDWNNVKEKVRKALTSRHARAADADEE